MTPYTIDYQRMIITKDFDHVIGGPFQSLDEMRSFVDRMHDEGEISDWRHRRMRVEIEKEAASREGRPYTPPAGVDIDRPQSDYR